MFLRCFWKPFSLRSQHKEWMTAHTYSLTGSLVPRWITLPGWISRTQETLYDLYYRLDRLQPRNLDTNSSLILSTIQRWYAKHVLLLYKYAIHVYISLSYGQGFWSSLIGPDDFFWCVLIRVISPQHFIRDFPIDQPYLSTNQIARFKFKLMALPNTANYDHITIICHVKYWEYLLLPLQFVELTVGLFQICYTLNTVEGIF